MVGSGWIHNFAVTDTQTHKGGFTIYKITSVVFPRSIPQALTCVTVWKRFHEIKRLHRELARRHKYLQLTGTLPEPTDCSFFKRFDANVIRRRREYILELLDFVALHPALYKCHSFTQFFNDGLSPTTSPLHQLHQLENGNSQKQLSHDRDKVAADDGVAEGNTGAIAEICDKLDLLYDPHDVTLTLIDPECDKFDENADNATNKIPVQNEKAAVDNDEQLQVEQGKDAVFGMVAAKPCRDYTRFLTPMASIESDDSDYIYEAALEFSHAVQAEANLEYKEAHVHYKRGVEVLLHGAKDDANDDRKFIAKAKISKYLARADDIYDKFLRDNPNDVNSANRSNFQLSIDVSDVNDDGSMAAALYLERPWNHLAKYKVVKVLGERVMQVQCITEPQRPTYIMKGIEKPPSNTPTQNVFLPQQIPYMVDLLAFFQSEQKIFLLLKQAEGGLLADYLRSYTPTVEKSENYASLFPEVNDTSEADADAEVASDASNVSVQDSGFIDCASNSEDNAAATAVNVPTENTDFQELVRCSQQLLQSVSNTLKEVSEPAIASSSHKLLKQQEQANKNLINKSPRKIKVSSRQIPEASLKQWARELAIAVHSLHAKGVILNDLHMENLLLGAKGQLLLTYFYQNEGLHADRSYIHKAYSPLAIAGHFVAPERPLTLKSDWWSYGVVLYELLFGLSFKSAHPGQMDLYGSVQYPENVEISNNAQDLLENLLQREPEERFDYEQIKLHAFFKGTNWTELEAQRTSVNNTNATIPTNISTE